MGVTRRTGLGAIAGAIFGARPAAEQAMQQLAKVNYPTPPYSGAQDAGWTDKISDEIRGAIEDPIAYEVKRIEHLNELVRSARGELTQYQKEDLVRYDKVSNKVRLKSVSKSYRKIMEARELQERVRQNWIDEAKLSLKRMFGIDML